MLNWILGIMAASLWALAYGWYHIHDIKAAWRRWRDSRGPRKAANPPPG